ncbi:MAG: hypothetical protein JWO56_1982, partial [Acidobacteria bacterium]|nr:hypothetical protein [Acidobacteriota bacterium]
MGTRFDEIELQQTGLGAEPDVEQAAPTEPPGDRAPLLNRLASLLVDVSLFLALLLALSPLLPGRSDLATAWQDDWIAIVSLVAFVLMIAYYYFVGSWLLWGKTVGGAIFDVKVITADGTAMDVRRASERFG